MSTEAVRFLITADDKATAKFRQVGKSVQDSNRELRNFSGASKDAAAVAGQLADSLGFAGGVDLANNISAVADQLQKISKLGSLAQASLVGVITVGAFELTQQIDQWVSGTAEWEAGLQRITKEMQQQSAFAARIASDQFKMRREDIQTDDPVEKRKAELALLQEINAEIEAQKQEVRDAKAELQGIESTWANTFGYAEEAVKLGQAHVDIEQNRLKQLQDQAKELRRSTSERQLQLDLAKKQAAEEESRKSAVQNMLSNLRDQNLQMSLSREEYEKQKAAAIGLNKEEQFLLSALQERRAELEKEQQARELAKRQAEDASRLEELAAQQRQQQQEKYIESIAKEAERLQKAQGQASPQLQAKESRLLSRGAEMDPQKVVMQSTAQLVEQAKKNIESQQRQEELLRKLVEQKIEVYS